MNLIDTESTVGRLVAERPELTRTLERLGIDYCCGGRKPLSQAVEEKGLVLSEVVARLEEALQPRGGGCEQRWLEQGLTELTRHIENEHHGFLRRELPRLQALAEKVARVHGEEHPELVRLRLVVDGFRLEIDAHMLKEEHILFPAIRERDAEGGRMPQGIGSLQGPIRAMEMEHDQAGAALAEMRELTSGFRPPMDACGSYRALFQGLEELESDMHRHVHEENNILFQRVMDLGW